jgi:hypothetical protein
MAALDLAGRTFGAWTIIRRVERPANLKQQGLFWLARCQCGNKQIHAGSKLNAGRSLNGCAQCRFPDPYEARLHEPEFQSWRGMRERCSNPNHGSFMNYGGRGIKVCPQWDKSYRTFLADMGPRPPGRTLDRIDYDGDYTPGNCRWADYKTQSRNSRHFRLTDAQVEEIRCSLAAGERQIDVAIRYGVCRSHISNIATGRARSNSPQDARNVG